MVMAVRGSELYYITFLQLQKHDQFYFDYSAANCIILCVSIIFSGIIARKNFATNLTSIKELNKEGIRGIASGEWAKCVEHVLSVEQVYWGKEIAVEEEHKPVVTYLTLDSNCSSNTDIFSEKEGM